MRNAALLPLALSLAVVPGCIAVAAAAVAGAAFGYVKYEGNEAIRDYRADIDETFEAVVEVLEERGYPEPTIKTLGSVERTIESGEAWVVIEAGDGFTRVRVRIGVFDTDAHRHEAGRLLQDVAALLGE